jgi:hypothetical protein
MKASSGFFSSKRPANVVRIHFPDTPRLPRLSLALVAMMGWVGGSSLPLRGAPDDGVVAVFSSISDGYVRTKLPDGSFKPETYAFGDGGRQTGASHDLSIDGLSFMDVARVMAPSLASQNYLPCDPKDPRKTDLLIMVYWGTTTGTDDTSSSAEYQIARALVAPPRMGLSAPPTGLGGTAMASDPTVSGRASELQQVAAVKAADDSAQEQSLAMSSLANRQRDRLNLQNAAILGYLNEMKRVQGYELTALSSRRQDIIDEVEESRYFVVLMAYDFQTLLQHKQRKLLWQTRFSIPEHRNDFSKQLAAMSQSASHYFGKNSEGLTRKALPSTNVRLGDLKTIGVEPEAGR